ncbi:MAG: hypothetical protein ACOCXF_05230 [bacterium]
MKNFRPIPGKHCESAAILIDPGPASDYKAVARKVHSIIALEDLEYIVLLHQDPDVAGSTTFFEINGFRGQIATH